MKTDSIVVTKETGNNHLSRTKEKAPRTNYAQISALSRENPVAITVNGKEDTVVLCHLAAYSEKTLKERECDP